MQQFVPAVVPQHANQGIVDFDETAVWTAEKQSFLNVVEQFAIAALGFTAIGDVLQHVDGLKALAAGGVYLRGRNQIGAFQDRVQVFVGERARASAERTRTRRRVAAQVRAVRPC